MNYGTDVRCAARLFQRLAAETGKARLPTAVGLKDDTNSWSGLEKICVPIEIVRERPGENRTTGTQVHCRSQLDR